MLKGCYEGFVKRAKVEDIEIISQSYDMLLNSDLLEEQRNVSKSISKWVRGHTEKIVKGNLSTREIRDILEKRWVCNIFTAGWLGSTSPG